MGHASGYVKEVQSCRRWCRSKRTGRGSRGSCGSQCRPLELRGCRGSEMGLLWIERIGKHHAKWGFPWPWGYPKWFVYQIIIEHPFHMDDFGVSIFQEASIYIYIYTYQKHLNIWILCASIVVVFFPQPSDVLFRASLWIFHRFQGSKLPSSPGFSTGARSDLVPARSLNWASQTCRWRPWLWLITLKQIQAGLLTWINTNCGVRVYVYIYIL